MRSLGQRGRTGSLTAPHWDGEGPRRKAADVAERAGSTQTPARPETILSPPTFEALALHKTMSSEDPREQRPAPHWY